MRLISIDFNWPSTGQKIKSKETLGVEKVSSSKDYIKLLTFNKKLGEGSRQDYGQFKAIT